MQFLNYTNTIGTSQIAEIKSDRSTTWCFEIIKPQFGQCKQASNYKQLNFDKNFVATIFVMKSACIYSKEWKRKELNKVIILFHRHANLSFYHPKEINNN